VGKVWDQGRGKRQVKGGDIREREKHWENYLSRGRNKGNGGEMRIKVKNCRKEGKSIQVVSPARECIVKTTCGLGKQQNWDQWNHHCKGNFQRTQGEGVKIVDRKRKDQYLLPEKKTKGREREERQFGSGW